MAEEGVPPVLSARIWKLGGRGQDKSKWQCRDLVEAMCRHDAKLRAKRLSDELSLGRP